MINKISEVTEGIYPSLVSWRRDFHKYAESGWVEFRTASIVASKLADWGFEVKAGREVIHEQARMGVPNEAFLQEQEERALSQGADPKWVGRCGTFMSIPPSIAQGFNAARDRL